jgi:hypothetical protein
MHERGKSDRSVVPANPPNKATMAPGTRGPARVSAAITRSDENRRGLPLGRVSKIIPSPSGIHGDEASRFSSVRYLESRSQHNLRS